jgi:DNA repair protein SbcC/Rad50
MPYSVASALISGFRGFKKPSNVKFGMPITVFYGLNRQGKSSVVNAIEWCLFGAEAATTSYLRERSGWEVKNRRAKDCFVECQLIDSLSEATATIRRTYKSKQKSEILITLPSGLTTTEEGEIAKLLRITLKDYSSAVHLHPEIIRDLVIAVPKVRKEAIDRLLGLSDLREMVDALAASKPASWTAQLDQQVMQVSSDIRAALEHKDRSIEADIQTLRDRNVQDKFFVGNGATLFAVEVLGEITSLASTYQYSLPPIDSPLALSNVSGFLIKLRQALQGLRNGNPVLRNQGMLRTKKNDLNGLLASFELQMKTLGESLNKRRALLDSFTEQELNTRIESLNESIKKVELEMQEIAANGQLLSKALDFFSNRESEQWLSCPLCGESSKDVESWKRHINGELVGTKLEPIQQRKAELQKELKSAGVIRSNLDKATEDISTQQRLLERCRQEAASGLRRDDITAADDIVVLLNEELSKTGDELAKLQDEVETVNAELSKIEDSIVILDKLERVSRTKAEMNAIENVMDNPNFGEMTACRLDCERHAVDSSILIDAIHAILKAEAKSKLVAAQNSIKDFFRAITNRPDFPDLLVTEDDTGYDIELGSSSETTKALSILNHGDLNCAALSIFLGLAYAAKSSHSLGVIVLDDPTQSLDSIAKKNLCNVLEQVATVRQVIIATADDEFKDASLLISKNKLGYHVKDWNEDVGPTLAALPTAAHHAI